MKLKREFIFSDTKDPKHFADLDKSLGQLPGHHRLQRQACHKQRVPRSSVESVGEGKTNLHFREEHRSKQSLPHEILFVQLICFELIWPEDGPTRHTTASRSIGASKKRKKRNITRRRN